MEIVILLHYIYRLGKFNTNTERLAYFRFLICTTAFLKYLRRKNNSHGLEMKNLTTVEDEIMIMDTV